MKLLLIIKADTNDADYVFTHNVITPEKLEELKPIFAAIAAFKPYKTKIEGASREWSHDHNWPNGDCYRDDLGEKTPVEIYAGTLTQDQVEEFEDCYVPCGIHDIVSIKVLEVANETTYYKHKYGG